MNSAPFPPPRYQAGFTLMELVVVVAILALIAYAALDSVAQDMSPVRFEDTRTRLNTIRAAVLGPPPGIPGSGITGFIADMGRVPNSPQELMLPPLQWVPVPSPVPPTWAPDAGTGLGAGWRGPYLHTFRETSTDTASTGQLALRDGWGNTAPTALGENIDADHTPSTAPMFGWRRFGPDSSNYHPGGTSWGNFYVQSYGSDGIADTGTALPSDLYMRDYPPAAPAAGATTAVIGDLPDPLVAARDYQIALPAPVSFELINNTSSPMSFDASKHVCASLDYVADGTVTTLFSSVAPANLPSTLNPGEHLTVDTISFPTVSSLQPWLPAGSVALRLRQTTDTGPAGCGAAENPAPLLDHTHAQDSTAACSADLTHPSPGLACGTRILAIIPPQLPASIEVSLTWP